MQEVVVATIGKAHGLKGEVSLLIRTDQPEKRLAPGSEYDVEVDGQIYPLTVEKTRTQQGRWYVRFYEITDRGLAEGLRGAELKLEVDPETDDDDEDAWYPEQLVGLSVKHIDGQDLGKVKKLEHYPAHDMLIVRALDGSDVMLPFVKALVPEVDITGGVITANPPGGLFPGEGEMEVSAETSADETTPNSGNGN